MSKTAALVRALAALGVAAGGVWYLSVYSCSYAGPDALGLPSGFDAVESDEEWIAEGRVRSRPPIFATGSLEHAHERYLAALPRATPQRLRFALPSRQELSVEAAAARRSLRAPLDESEVDSTAHLWSPAGLVEKDLLFFAWDGAIGLDAEVEITEADAREPLVRFRVSGSGGWYPASAPILEPKHEYACRLAWRGGSSKSSRFRVAGAEETRDYAHARRALQSVTHEPYRAILAVLLARADGRTSTELELARRALTYHPDQPLAAALRARAESDLGLSGAVR